MRINSVGAIYEDAFLKGYVAKRFESFPDQDLNRLHIFECTFEDVIPPTEYRSENKSGCGNVKTEEQVFVNNEFISKNEKDMIIRCLESEHLICAHCFAHVFNKFQEKNKS